MQPISNLAVSLQLASFILLLLLLSPPTIAQTPPSKATTTTTTITKGTTITKPGCPRKCGNLTVPYPFGVGLGSGCALNPSLEINCNTSSNPPMPLITQNQLHVYDISDSQVWISNSVTTRCYTPTGGMLGQNSAGIDLGNSSPYTFSDKNKFTVVGCDDSAVMTGNNLGNGKRFGNGCVVSCNKPENVIGGSCIGSAGCCQITIPNGLKTANVTNMRSPFGHARVWSGNPCGYAFIGEAGRYSFRGSDDLKDSNFSRRVGESVPIVLDWAIGNLSCEGARKKDDYACKEKSHCVDVDYDYGGYRCSCDDGYMGNPYISQGCQDIDECEDPNENPCEKICTNTPLGSYTCSCPDGYTGDGKKNGQGCVATGSEFPWIKFSVDFVMDHRSMMAIAKAKAAEEIAAKAAEAARRAAAGVSGATADAAPKPAPSKKKRPATDGQKKLTEAGVSVSKKTKRAPSPSPASEAGTLTVPSVGDGGPVVDLTVADDAAPALPLVQEPRTQRAGKEVAGATYQKVIEYPVGGGVFNELVPGHVVLAKAMPAKDRAHLKKLEDPKIYEGGMDLLVQSAFMLMESHKRQYWEIARLQALEQKAASADEAVACLDRLREDAKALQAKADEVVAARDVALVQLEESKRELAESRRALEAEKRRSEEAAKAKAEAEAAVVRAADEAVEKFLAEGWKADERLPWCYEVVAARLENWGMNSPAGREYFSQEMSVYYNLGQERMQRLLYRRLSRALKAMNYTAGWARRNLKLPKLMKDPEGQATLPLSERESPIESSGLGEPDYTEFDFLDDATSAAAGQEAEADEEGADEVEEPAPEA
ncbi:unnamed protein product [Cuscuta europaea]|uniref:EGF-like domain-containing protein n=1 Tax=Cuscuta europaea TaxID=41803 RepID=A0A9P0ZKD1_CUSEU|nr:unnamed protein product [Cuscuta europaea]